MTGVASSGRLFVWFWGRLQQEKLIEQEKFGLMQREKHRKLAEKVHGSQASVCRQRDRWKVEFFTEAGVTLNARLLLLSPYGVCVVQASRI
jgi:hypothetical protein